MSHLKNARHEAFCQALATGKSQSEAYASAGYRPDDGHAARLAGNGKIKARVAELLGQAADKALVTIGSIAAQLDEDRQLAFRQGQAGAAVSASLAKARLFGLLIDRAEVETIIRKPMREAAEVQQMSLQEWEQRFRPKSSSTQPGDAAPATRPEGAEPAGDFGIAGAIRRAEAARLARSTSP